MRNLLDGTDSRTLGRVFEGLEDACEELTDLVLQSLDGKAIAEEAERGYGVILEIDAQTRERYGLAPTTAALFYITDDDPMESVTELRELEASEAKRIIDESLSVAVERVVQHYRANPRDDGHPAYRLFELNEAYRQRALEHAG